MKTNKQTKHLQISLILFLITTIHLNAQVTIGSNIEPNKGALLELKEFEPSKNNTNATRGLILPRIILESSNTLDDINKGNIVRPDIIEHIGLTVYNVNECFHDTNGEGGAGPYVWNGGQWMPLIKTQYVLPDIWFDGNRGSTTIHLKSGKDKRGEIEQPVVLPIEWNGDATINSITSAISNRLVVFDPDVLPDPSSLPSALTGQSIVYSLNPKILGTSSTNPFRSRETTVSFYVTGKCGSPVTRELILNQTNYAITANGASKTLNLQVTDINNTPSLTIKSNSTWKLDIKDTNEVLSGHTFTSSESGFGGEDLINDKSNSFAGTISMVYPAQKYEAAIFTFSDTKSPARPFPVEVTVWQCRGLANMDNITEDVVGYGPNKVMRHLDARPTPNKADYYFYSADFGDAGRWMVTNVAAIKYETIGRTGSDNVANQNPVFYNSTFYNDVDKRDSDAYWAYPDEGGKYGQSSKWYEENYHLGLLYNWAAATNYKGGADGRQHFYNEDDLKYGEPIPDAGGATVQKIQGICPNGWHLPSDYEWTQLENEIIERTSHYSSLGDIGKDYLLSGKLPSEGKSVYRGKTIALENGLMASHGTAMLGLCEPGSLRVNPGLSLKVSEGGFDLTLTGGIGGNGYNISYKEYTMQWTSSSAKIAFDASTDRVGAMARWADRHNELVRKSVSERSNGFAVRCKKDDTGKNYNY